MLEEIARTTGFITPERLANIFRLIQEHIDNPHDAPV